MTKKLSKWRIGNTGVVVATVRKQRAEKAKRATLATSLLTDAEREDGWYKCEEVNCADLKQAGYGRGLPHIHRDRSKS
jgi:hypothetical protein